ncbi:MAG: hypothetical protein QOF76_456 [Solirubrobacteraceae bacterium]|jgi:hypothetical protein|nr:hypothetical protein [Solirubrobacteraceae bacterium]
MLSSRRARLALLALVAAGLAVADVQLALTLAPALLVAALPLAQWFLGERLIVARRTPARIVRRRSVSRWTRQRPRALKSVLERSPRTLRGPPVAA